jgi:hypothetical protein
MRAITRASLRGDSQRVYSTRAFNLPHGFPAETE